MLWLSSTLIATLCDSGSRDAAPQLCGHPLDRDADHGLAFRRAGELRILSELLLLFRRGRILNVEARLSFLILDTLPMDSFRKSRHGERSLKFSRVPGRLSALHIFFLDLRRV